MKVRLSASGCDLDLMANDDGWCRCVLDCGNGVRDLGADTVSVVVERLWNLLTSTTARTPAGTIDGLTVFSVLGLYEEHHWLYASANETSLILFWQDARSSPPSTICRMTLSPPDQQAWITALQSLSEATS